MPSLNHLCSWVPGSRFASLGMTACVIGLAAGGREGRFGNGSKSGLVEGRGTPKRSILSLSESLSASPQLSNLRPSAASRSQKNLARSAISVRPGPALLPWRIAYRAFAVSAPHLGLTLVLPELCRSTERAGLWGKTHTIAGATAPAPVRPPEPPSRVAQSRRRRSPPHVTTPRERAPQWAGTAGI